MNKCPKCGKEFEGNFCPQCGISVAGKKLCPNCKALVTSDAKFCKECGFTLTPQVQPVKKKKAGTSAWIKKHEKLVAVIVTAIALAIIASIVAVAVINRHNGTYYYYANEVYNYEKYYIFKGNTYTDETGYSCDLKFDGEKVELYGELFGVKDVFARGTLKGGVLKLEILGAEVTYAEKGHVHKLNEEEIIKEPTCEEEGSSISYCDCGYRAKEPKAIPALGHDFDENHLCKRCGVENGVLLEFVLNEEETAYAVKGIGNCKDGVILIPSKYNKLPVTSIGSSAFKSCSGLTSITIPDSVTAIGSSAFDGCGGLASIEIPDSVTSIEIGAFQYCNGLKEVHISDLAVWCGIDFGDGGANPLSCAHHLYLDGAELKDLTIHADIKEIKAYAFQGCSGLTSIIIPDIVTSIGEYAFYGCSRLTSVAIGSGVTSIGSEAFSGCSGLISITIPDNVTEIGEKVFYGCSGLTSITISDGVTSIGGRAFYDCNRLTSITIPDSVISIGAYAFAYCSRLISVTFGSGVTSIADCAFRDSELTEIRYKGTIDAWKKIKKYSGWDWDTGSYTVICIDGEITKGGKETKY